ncbi:hypothetical protein UQW22_02250 [Isoptericola halotolerans]|uniref:hypothetical protein n=1 Tax=Isoptericola halotolerans TaxID=300560 RepID=UPI00388D1837
MVDLETAPTPRGVVGTPTYLLGDDIISLGNPELADLLLQLDEADGPPPGDDA